MGGKQLKNCIVCNKEFEVEAYRADKAKFCSKECYWTHKGRDKVEIVCEWCGAKKSVPRLRKDSKYCGAKCMGNAKKGVPRDEKTKEKISETVSKRYGYTEADRQKPCAICGEIVKRDHPSHLGENPTCSKECYRELLRTDPRIKEGRKKGNRTMIANRKKYGLSEAHKQALRDAKAKSGKRAEYECEWCGKKTVKYKSGAEKYKHQFCSHACKNRWLKVFAPRGKEHHSYGVPPPKGAGRCKWHEYHSHVAGRVMLQGSLELRFAKILDESGLRWVRPTKDRFEYMGLDGVSHTYNPDFKVWTDDSTFVYVETKGYLDKRCRHKLSAVSDSIPLVVLFEGIVGEIESGIVPLMETLKVVKSLKV